MNCVGANRLPGVGRSCAVWVASQMLKKFTSLKKWHHELRFAAHAPLYCSDAAQVLSWLPLPLPACVPAVQARWPSPSEGCSLPRARVRCKARATSRCALYSPEVGSLSILVHDLAYCDSDGHWIGSITGSSRVSDSSAACSRLGFLIRRIIRPSHKLGPRGRADAGSSRASRDAEASAVRYGTLFVAACRPLLAQYC
jgi:hypothetical protein